MTAPDRAAVFFDRDGTLIVEKEYLSDPAQVELLPGAGAALAQLRDADFRLFIVTNQSGIGRGYFSREDCDRVNAALCRCFAQRGVTFTKIYVAPEAPEEPSRGRKPSPQFLFDARDEFGVNLAASYFVGDKRIDIECGGNAGVRRSLLVRTGYGRDTERELRNDTGTLIFDDVIAASQWILRDRAGGGPHRTER